MRNLLLHLPGSGAGLRSPWSGVLLRAVVRRSYQSHADGLLFVSQPRTQPPLPSTPRDSSCGGSPARLIHSLATHKKKKSSQTCLSLVVVVVVLTVCSTRVSLHPSRQMHLIMGPCPCGHDPRPCTCVQGPKKSTPHPSCQDRQLELVAGMSTTLSRPPRNATVGARLSPPRLHSRIAGPHNRDVDHLIYVLQLENLCGLLEETMGICICATTGMSTTLSKNSTSCNCGTSTVFCS